jgi:PAS domain S-box-containing protein
MLKSNTVSKQIWVSAGRGRCQSIMNNHDFLRQTPVLLLAVAADGALIEVSDHWLQTLGYDRNMVLGRSWADFLAPPLRRTVQSMPVSTWLAEAQSGEVVCQLVRRDGIWLDMLAMVTAQHAAHEPFHYLITLVDLSGRQSADQAMGGIAQQIAQATGDHFFRTLVRQVACAFDVRYALVTECTDHTQTRLRTLAYSDGSEILENIEYRLSGTPCAGVLAGTVCYYPAGLSRLFRMELAEESYLGVPMYDSGGNLVGHLAVLNDKPMQLSARQIAVLQFFAVRAGAEVERQRAALAHLSESADWTEESAMRSRLVRTQHDSVLQTLYSLSLLAEGWRRLAQRGLLDQVDEALAELGQISQQALREMRQLGDELRAPALRQTGDHEEEVVSAIDQGLTESDGGGSEPGAGA